MDALYEDNVGMSFNDVAFPANGSGGTPFAFAGLKGASDKGRTISWRTSFTGGPSAVNVELQQSMDGEDWFSVDSSTATGGEYRTVSNVRAKFVRAFLVTRTGGTNITVEILV